MTEELDYTPGPWRVQEGDNYTIISMGDGNGVEKTIAEVTTQDEMDETISNANLIASAPQMYETLKGLLKIAKKQLSIVEDEPAKMALGFIRDEIKGSLSKLK